MTDLRDAGSRPTVSAEAAKNARLTGVLGIAFAVLMVLALLFVIIEMATLEFTFLMLGTGTLIGGLGLNLLGAPWLAQVLGAAVVSALLLFTIRPLLLRLLRRSSTLHHTNVDAVVGMSARAVGPFVDGDGSARLDNGVRPHERTGANRDLADVHPAARDPPRAQRNAIPDRSVGTDAEQGGQADGAGRDRGTAADAGAEQPQIGRHQRGATEHRQRPDREQQVERPESDVGRTPEPISTWSNAHRQRPDEHDRHHPPHAEVADQDRRQQLYEHLDRDVTVVLRVDVGDGQRDE